MRAPDFSNTDDPRTRWQIEELARYGDVARRACFAETRLGKTLVGVAKGARIQPRAAGVITPLTVAPQWAAILAAHGFNVIPAYRGTLEATRAAIKAARKAKVPWIAVAAWERLATVKRTLRRPTEDDAEATEQRRYRSVGDALLAAADHEGLDYLIVDESHYAAGNSAQGRWARRIAWKSDAVLLLSGTPGPNDYGGLWGQMTMVNNAPLPDSGNIEGAGWGTAYTPFAERYLLRDTLYPSRIEGHNPLHIDELQAMLTRDASFWTKEQVFGRSVSPPPMTRLVDLPPRARTIYDQLAAEWIVDEENMEAAHILKRIVRLQQMSAGFLVRDDEERTVVDLHTAKYDAIASDARDVIASGEKLVVFHRFVREGQRLEEALRKVAGKRVYFARIGRMTPADERYAITEAFNRCTGPAIVLAQTKTAGVGISLAMGDHTFFASRSFKYVEERQAIDRTFEPGKPRFVTFYESARTVDQFVSAIVASKGDVQESIMHADTRRMLRGSLKRPKFRT